MSRLVLSPEARALVEEVATARGETATATLAFLVGVGFTRWRALQKYARSRSGKKTERKR